MTYIRKFAAHVVLVFFAFLLSFSLRRGLGLEWWSASPEAILILSWAALYAGIAAVFELVFKTERSAWSYTSINDISRLVQVTAVTALTFLALIFISNRGISLPRSTILLSWILSLFALIGVRVLARLVAERSLGSLFMGLNPKPAHDAKALVLVGEARHVVAYLRRHAADRATTYQPVAIIVREPGLVGQAIHGVPVVGRYEKLEGILQSSAFLPPERVSVLFLEDPIKDMGLSVELVGHLRAAHRPLLRQPSLTELRTGGEALREIGFEEFLPRQPVALEPSPIERLIAGKRVLVTGAGGSIGSEICRQLVGLGCSHISLIDHSEFLLFEIERGLVHINSDVSRRAVLCDVRDSDRMIQIFDQERPDLVFHAAALKHVTLVEQNPCQAVLTNVLGTWNASEAARRSRAAQFVLISTDKAVDPSSFMGATKRLAESIFPESSDALRYCVVRFGNVLGSAGSVIPIFRSQIERGGPVTVTHPDVERYFMTIPEAVQLVLHAAATSATASPPRTQKFLLEMGKPVRIQDLARQMIELCGLRPDSDIQIEFTGLKPGEKLTEELTDINETAAPMGVGLSQLETLGRVVGLSQVEVARLAKLARSEEPAVVREAVAAHVRMIRAQPSANR